VPESYDPFAWSSSTPLDVPTLLNREAEVEEIDDRLANLEAEKTVVDLRDFVGSGFNTNYSSDNIPAINAAISQAPVGSVIWFPPNSDVGIASPINLNQKTGITLKGPRSTLWPHRFDNNAPEFNTPIARIRLLPGFTGGAALELQGRAAPGNTPVGSWTIEDLEFSGRGYTGGQVVHGIHSWRDASDIQIRRVSVHTFTGNGWLADLPGGVTETTHDVFVERMVCFNNTLSGFDLLLTDGELNGLVGSGNNDHGFILRLLANTRYKSLQALSNRKHGLFIPTGATADPGHEIDIQTDANYGDGVRVEGVTGGRGVVNFSNIVTHRDGYLPQGADTPVGVRVFNTTRPVVIDHIFQAIGFPYDAANMLPDTGLRVAGSSTAVNVASGFIKGRTVSTVDASAGGTALSLGPEVRKMITTGGTGTTETAEAPPLIPNSRLASSGTADATTYLAGDRTWKTTPTGGGGSGSWETIPTAATGTATNTAITNTSAGGTVLLPAGTVSLADVRVGLKDKVNIKGRGKGVTVLKAGAGTSAACMVAASGDTVSDIKISDLTIDGSHSDLALNVRGIQVTTGARIVFENVEIINTGQSGILLQTGTVDCEIERCRFDGNGRSEATDAHSVSVTGSSHRNKIVRNTIINHRAMGICIGTVGAGSTDCEISENYIGPATVTPVGFESIGVTVDCIRTIITDNQCIDSQDNSISITANDCTCTGNTCNGSVNNGISVGGNSATIVGNVVKNCGREVSGTSFAGISLNGSTGGQHCTVIGNRIYDDQGTKTMEYGIRESAGADFNQILGNECRTSEVITAAVLTVGANTVVSTGGSGAANDIVARALGSIDYIFKDSFTRPDGAPGTAETGQTYELTVGAPVISSGKLTASAAYVLLADVGTSNIDYSGTCVPQTGAAPSLLLRSDATDQNRLAIAVSLTSGFAINKVDGGSTTTLRSVPYGFVAGNSYDIRVVAYNDVIVGFVNGELLLTYVLTAAEQTEYSAYTRIGLRNNTTTLGVTWENLSARRAFEYPDVVVNNFQTGTTYTVASSDLKRLIQMSNASLNTVTLPPNSTVPIPIGFSTDIAMWGAGITTVAAGAGVTRRSRGDAYRIAGQYGACNALKVGTDEWLLSGDLMV
jgi:hypothetical protein